MQEKKQSKQDKKERNRKLCGKTSKQVVDGLGMLQYVKFYCNQRDCQVCGPAQLKRRQKEVMNMLRGAQDFYSIVVEEKSVKNFTNKIRGNNYLAMPQADGTSLFLMDKFVEFKFANADHLDRHSAIGLATSEQNIFTPKNRSTGGEWRLTEPPSESVDEIGDITFHRLVPYLDPPGNDEKMLYLLNSMRASANIWTHGILDPEDSDMVQRFADHVSSAFIEMALREGFKFNYEMSYVREECVPISKIAKWIGASIDGKVIFFTKESERALKTISPHLLPIITGHAGIPNWRIKYNEWRHPNKTFEDYGIQISDLVFDENGVIC